MALKITLLETTVEVLAAEIARRDSALNRMSEKLDEAYELIMTRARERAA